MTWGDAQEPAEIQRGVCKFHAKVDLGHNKQNKPFSRKGRAGFSARCAQKFTLVNTRSPFALKFGWPFIERHAIELTTQDRAV